MAEEKKNSSCWVVVICGNDECCRVLKCDSEEAQELLGKLEGCSEDGDECGE